MNAPFAAVILNYNAAGETIACARSLLASAHPPVFIVLVDNASTDDSAARLVEWGRSESFSHTPPACWGGGPAIDGIFRFHLLEGTSFRPDPAESAPPLVLLLRHEKNLGYAAGNNAGISWLLEHTPAEHFLILNNDTLIHRDAAEHLLSAMRDNHRSGLCGGLIRYQDEPNIVQCRCGGRHSAIWGLSSLNGWGSRYADMPARCASGRDRLDFIYGACVLVRREFLLDVGLMDEGYFLFCEEQDWAFRARGKWELACAPRAEILHAEGRSTGARKKGLGGLRRNRILLRSRLRLAWKFHPWFLPTVLLGQVYALVKKVLTAKIR